MPMLVGHSEESGRPHSALILMTVELSSPGAWAHQGVLISFRRRSRRCLRRSLCAPRAVAGGTAAGGAAGGVAGCCANAAAQENAAANAMPNIFLIMTTSFYQSHPPGPINSNRPCLHQSRTSQFPSASSRARKPIQLLRQRRSSATAFLSLDAETPALPRVGNYGPA